MAKKVDFKEPALKNEDVEQERIRLRKMMEERMQRPCTYMVTPSLEGYFNLP